MPTIIELKEIYNEGRILYELNEMYENEQTIKPYVFNMGEYKTIPLDIQKLIITNYKKTIDMYEDIMTKYLLNKPLINVNKHLAEWLKIKLPETKFRINQTEAFDRLDKYGLETGIHCQATGCGKTYIILRTITKALDLSTVPKVILFTERVNILADLFAFDDNVELLQKWKQLGIADLTEWNIINRVTNKKKDWIQLLTDAKQSTLLVINRAFLTNNMLYKKINNKILHLVVHDECHNTSSVQCHKFLTHCIKLKIPIVGFSATPLRAGKHDKELLLKIYGKNNQLNLLTNYNMIHAIDTKLILPPVFHWFEMSANDKYNITLKDVHSVLNIINSVIVSCPNKKIIAWCGTIAYANKWQELFVAHHKEYINLKNFSCGIDTSVSQTNDYEIFKNSIGNSILFCANKHREGSDIRFLDACIFLDKVKNRGAIPFIQSIGRTLRLCLDTPTKINGNIIDCIIKDDDYEKQFIDKVIGYYIALTNIADEEINTYNGFRAILQTCVINKNTQTVHFTFGGSEVKINCKSIKWSNILNNFENILQRKINIDDIYAIEYAELKQNIADKKIKSQNEYKQYASEHKYVIDPHTKYLGYGWTDWCSFLNIQKSDYIDEVVMKIVCKRYKIKTEQQYMKHANKYNMPLLFVELYKKPLESILFI